MSRKEELLQAVDNNAIFVPLIDDLVCMEKELEQLRALPMIKVDPANPMRQKVLPVAKRRKDLQQAYMNGIKILMKATKPGDTEAESLLQSWLKKNVEYR